MPGTANAALRRAGMVRKLKVFRTPIGFHDAYVAAPSRKAALAAWGAEADLFARGVAEEVTEAKLTKVPLARPGEVIRVARGSEAEHFAALPPAKCKPKPAQRQPKASQSVPETKVRSRPPRPSRATLEQAEAALAEASGAFDREERTLARRERELAAERQRFERERRSKLAKLAAARDAAADRYRTAVAEWAP